MHSLLEQNYNVWIYACLYGLIHRDRRYKTAVMLSVKKWSIMHQLKVLISLYTIVVILWNLSYSPEVDKLQLRYVFLYIIGVAFCKWTGAWCENNTALLACVTINGFHSKTVYKRFEEDTLLEDKVYIQYSIHNQVEYIDASSRHLSF